MGLHAHISLLEKSRISVIFRPLVRNASYWTRKYVSTSLSFDIEKAEKQSFNLVPRSPYFDRNTPPIMAHGFGHRFNVIDAICDFLLDFNSYSIRTIGIRRSTGRAPPDSSKNKKTFQQRPTNPPPKRRCRLPHLFRRPQRMTVDTTIRGCRPDAGTSARAVRRCQISLQM